MLKLAPLNFANFAPLRLEVTQISELDSVRRTVTGSGLRIEDSLDITRDPETAETAFEAIRLLAAGVSLIFVSYLAYNSTRLGTPGISGVILLDVSAGAVAGLIFWLASTRRVPTSRFQVLSAALALTVALNVAISIPISRETGDLQFMIAVAIGGAASVVSTRWLVIVLAIPAVLGLCSAVVVCSHRELVGFIGSQTGASIVAVIIYLGRVRSQRRLLTFRIRDAKTNGELTKALERAECEFKEHQATELQRLELLEQLRQAQKLEALGTLAGGVAHDINNVIGGITAIASVTINEIPNGGPGRKALQEILVAARRSTTLTRNLVRFARQEQPRHSAFAPDEDVVLEVAALLRRTLSKDIELKTDCGCQGWVVMGDAGLVSHALMNLCINASDACSAHGSIAIQTQIVDICVDEAQELGVRSGSYVEISVRDDGHGMGPEVLRRAFEPFFSTKEGQRRSGLGLPMVYGTIQQHNGGLKVQSEPEKGTKVRVVLPAFQRTNGSAEQKRLRNVQINSLRPVALFVDDEPLLRKAGKRMLISLGYEVMLASNGQEALARYLEHRHRIGVVVLDVAMPIMSGAECCRELKRINANLPVLLASGFPKGADLQSLLTIPNVQYLQKPYELDEFVASLAELEQAYQDSLRISCQVNLIETSRSVRP
jgi:signal transduction histidine kinase/ActR/RegA family two-component response regulator